MSHWCCETWKDLSPELAGLKVASLEKLMKRGIPKSTFSPVFRLIEGMTNYCPLCGTQINHSTHVSSQKQSVVIKPVESKIPPTIKCPICRGTGKVGGDSNCMTCLGAGVLDKSNPHRKTFDADYAKEMADKMEEKDRERAKLEEELRKNPKPLRDDAKPENWAR
jgi:hypothetical protein